MPSFCRHNRLVQNCSICSREQSIEARPLVSSGAPRVNQPRPDAPPRPSAARPPAAGRRAAGAGVRVRMLDRGQDDGYRSALVPGVKSSSEAERLAAELAFAAARLEVLEHAPPGLYAEVASGEDVEEATWLAFLIAYLGPLETAEPFAEVARVRTPWASGAAPELGEVSGGPRGAHRPDRGPRTLEAYRAWAARAGRQAEAFTGESGWTGERRFARVYERLALPGLHRDARYELLVTLGRLGRYALRPASLALGGENAVTVAAKRAFGIGDPLLLERRAATLAQDAGLPLEALDLGLYNWERRERVRAGMPDGLDGEPEPVRRALAL